MDDEVFNMALRKFLKEVGVSSQREIERAVKAGLDGGRLTGDETLSARVILTIEGLEFEHRVDGRIALA